MSSLLFRVLRRKTSLELDSAEDFVDAEMKKNGEAELNLSVFEIDDDEAQVARTQAEYNASFKDPQPPDVARGVDLRGLDGFDVQESLASTFFRFTQTRHRDLCFLDEAGLVGVAAQLLATRAQRARVTPREAVRLYIRGRLTSGDPEWVELCTAKPDWRKWAVREPKAPASAVARNAQPSKAPPPQSSNSKEPQPAAAAASAETLHGAEGPGDGARIGDGPPPAVDERPLTSGPPTGVAPPDGTAIDPGNLANDGSCTSDAGDPL